MPNVLSLVNSVSSTSIPVEIAAAVNDKTDSQVIIGSMLQDADAPLDPDVAAMDTPVQFFGGTSNFDPTPYKRLERHLRVHSYDVVHTHHNFTGSVGRVIASLSGHALVNTEHNDHRFFSLAQRAANSATYLLPDANVYNSWSTMKSLDSMTRRLSPRDEIIYNGVDMGRVVRGEDYTLPFKLPDKTIVTNVGVMTEQKNQQLFLEAIAQLDGLNALGDLHFVIAGSGPLEATLQAEARNLEVDDHILFTGYLPEREQIYKLLHESDIFVTPSHYEGFCVAAVEAMACGLPIIASDIDVFREVIGSNGTFIPTKRSDRLASAIVKNAEKLDSDSLNVRRAGLRKRAMSVFPLEKTARRYHELYCDVLE